MKFFFCLVLSIGIGCCYGFLLTRYTTRYCFLPMAHPRLENSLLLLPDTGSGHGYDLSICLGVNENTDRLSAENPNGSIVMLPKSSVGTVSRRTALILSAVSTGVTSCSTRSSAITLSNSEISKTGANGSKSDILDSAEKPINTPNNAAIHRNMLESSSIYKVRSQTPTAVSINKLLPRTLQQGPSVDRVSHEGLLADLRSKRAVFLGEHHPERRDHVLQAALIRSLHTNAAQQTTQNHPPAAVYFTNTKPKIAVGLEAVQRQFQPVLDKYCAGVIDEEQVKKETEWEPRWYWSFEAYRPILETCRELGIPLLALDISTEDRLLVEEGGLKALDLQTLQDYVPDTTGFEFFGSTVAYEAFVNYTLKPPYNLQKRSPLGKRNNATMPFSNFVDRQMLRDEAMASVAAKWLGKNPTGLFVGCVGTNHATFGCGVSGRLERMLLLSDDDGPNNKPKQQQQQRPSKQMVASVLLNPEPLNTGTELKVCQAPGKPPVVEDDEDEDDLARQIFVPNTRNQVCIENSFELQNYALQLQYDVTPVSPSNDDPLFQTTTIVQKAAGRGGNNVLQLADYLVFSPKQIDQ